MAGEPPAAGDQDHPNISKSGEDCPTCSLQMLQTTGLGKSRNLQWIATTSSEITQRLATLRPGGWLAVRPSAILPAHGLSRRVVTRTLLPGGVAGDHSTRKESHPQVGWREANWQGKPPPGRLVENQLARRAIPRLAGGKPPRKESHPQVGWRKTNWQGEPPSRSLAHLTDLQIADASWPGDPLARTCCKGMERPHTPCVTTLPTGGALANHPSATIANSSPSCNLSICDAERPSPLGFPCKCRPRRDHADPPWRTSMDQEGPARRPGGQARDWMKSPRRASAYSRPAVYAPRHRSRARGPRLHQDRQ